MMDLVAAIPLRDLIELAAALAIGGLVTGILAGVFGVGGGAVIVPVLVELFDQIGVADEVQMHLAVGTSLAIIIPTAIRSFRSHKARGSVDEGALKAWFVPVAAGALTGVAIAAFVTSDALKAVFAVFALCMSGNLLFGRQDLRIASELPSRAAFSAWGFLIAVLSALIGIGGGALGALCLTLYGRPIHTAIGTSSALGALIALPGALGYAVAGWPEMAELPPLSIGYVSLIGVVLMAPLSVLAAPLGVRIAHGLTRRQLSAAFGVFLALVALRFAWDLAT